jgi:hypothetical protein
MKKPNEQKQVLLDLQVENPVSVSHSIQHADDGFDDKTPIRLAKDSIAERRELCLEWWDQLSKYVVLLFTAGWKPQKIADYLGMSLKEDILPILDPRPIERRVADFTKISRKPDQLAKLYREVVHHGINFSLGIAYGNASGTAENEGFPELTSALIERQRFYDNLVKQSRQFVCSIENVPDKQWIEFVSVHICACMDHRLALGIDKDPVIIQLTQLPLADHLDIQMSMIKNQEYDDTSGIGFQIKQLTILRNGRIKKKRQQPGD